MSSDFNVNYTPLRSSPPRKPYSSSKSANKKATTHKKKRSNVVNLPFHESLEYKPPSLLHEEVVNSLRREKDSL